MPDETQHRRSVFFSTLNTIYRLEDTSDPRYKRLYGGAYDGNLVDTPAKNPTVGEPFYATFERKNLQNQINTVPGTTTPLAGQTLQTSLVQEVYDEHPPKGYLRSYELSDSKGRNYTITDTNDPNIQLLSGCNGYYENNEILADHYMPEKNMPLKLIFAQSPTNQQRGFTEKQITTDPISAIQVYQFPAENTREIPDFSQSYDTSFEQQQI